MSVKSGQAVTRIFTTQHPATKAPTDADATPTGTLYVNGTANAATVTVTNITTGVYKAAVTLPTLMAGDSVDLRIAATVATVAGTEVIWTATADTKRVSDLNDIAAGAKMDLVDAPNATALTAIKTAMEAAGSTLATLLSRIVGTLLAGNHSPQSGDGYAVVSNATYGNSALKTLLDTTGIKVATNADKTGYALTASYDAAKYATQSTVWTDTKAGYLDAAVTSRAAAATALSTATWTDAKAGYLTGNVALAASLSTANTNIAAVLADTGTDGVVVATASKNAIADQVWDEAVADHVTAGSAGRFLQRVYRYFFNKRTHTNSAVTVYADDGTTADATMVVSGDTTTVTKAAPS